MNARPEISVVIPTFNRAESLELTLQALVGQTLPAARFEVIVVDDGSSDDTGARVAAFGVRHPDFNLRYERHAANRYRAAACNTGVRAARGEWVVFTDDDIRPVPGWVGAHLRRQQAEAGEVAVTGLVLYPLDWERASNWVRFANDNYRQNETVRRLPSGGLPPHRFAGGNTSLRRETLDRVGGFDESVRRGQDGEFACRMHQAGIRLLYESEALAYHYAEVIRTIEGTLRSFRRYYEMDRPIIQRRFPWVYQEYAHWFLSPCGADDCLRRRTVKKLVRLVARRSGQRLALGIVRRVDCTSWLYWRWLYRYVMVCEAIDAIRAAERAASTARTAQD